MDELENDPIDEALDSVFQQFAATDAPNSETTQSASADAQPTDDLEALDGDSDGTETQDASDDSEVEIPWDNPESPLHQHYLQHTEALRVAEQAEQRREQAQQLLANIQAARENQTDQQLVNDLNELDPEISVRVQDTVGRYVRRADAARNESLGFQHGMAALHMALEAALPQDTLNQVLDQARVLVKADSLERMQQMVQGRQQESQTIADLRNQLKTLQLQVAAQGGNPMAQMVDSTPAQPRRKTRPQETETFDEFFDSLDLPF